MKHLSAKTAGVHLPGKLNEYSDRPSHISEEWWGRTDLQRLKLTRAIKAKFGKIVALKGELVLVAPCFNCQASEINFQIGRRVSAKSGGGRTVHLKS